MITKFVEFINEELRRIKSYSSNSGSSKSYDLVYDDPTDPKSPSSGILLRDELREKEFQDMMELAGEFLPEYTVRYFINNPNKSKRIEKFLVTVNNLKFLKDKESELGELRCEYCNKGPLVIYDINPGNITPEMLLNRNYKFNEKFNKSDGATCDHKVPQSKGGNKFDYDNLAVCCYRCNQRKANMSYDDWLRLNENEFTKLATHLMDDMDKSFKFTSPADDVRLRFCSITFPDGVKIRFRMHENLHSDTETVTLRPIEGSIGGDISSHYLNLYGRKLQFDNYISYKRIRLYMNRGDLFDTSFDGYIYDSGKLGAIDVQIEIDWSNDESIDTPRDILEFGIFRGFDSVIMRNALVGAVSILKDKEYVHAFRTKKNSIVHDFIEVLENTKDNEVIPNNINYNGMSLIGYLYLYTIIYTEYKEAIKIIKSSNKKVDKEELIGLLYIIG